MKKVDNTNKKSIDKINNSKQIIKEEKKKIKLEKKIIRKRKLKNIKNSKFGKLLLIFSDSKDNYSFSEVFGITLVSLVLGIFVCMSIFTIIFGGRNYFKMAKRFGKIYDVYEVLIDNYNGDIDKNELIDSAIDGMVSSVGDVYTSYSDTKTTDNFDEMVNGTYEGIGCTIMQEKDKITVVEVYDNTPAFKAGLKANDIIKSVDDKDALELGVSELSNYIKNESNGKVKMVINRDDKEITINLERSKVEIPMVVSKVYEENNKKVGYINISLFSSIATKQFENALKKLDKEGIKGLVIDVRGNSGGYLSTVTDITSLLLPKGKIIYQVQKGDKKNATKDKTSAKEEYPIAVLTNSSSASASEILAAAIKESYKGYVVGTKTYGKGTVQQVKKLSDGSMIKYTTQNWLTPSGNWINEVGIEPTDEVTMDEKYYDDPNEENDNQLKKALELVSK